MKIVILTVKLFFFNLLDLIINQRILCSYHIIIAVIYELQAKYQTQSTCFLFIISSSSITLYEEFCKAGIIILLLENWVERLNKKITES